jgi:hypothetical protein
MTRQTLVAGSKQMFGTQAKIRSALTKCDDNFTELYAGNMVSISIPAHASKLIYGVFIAPEALTITGVQYVPDVAQGGALTAVVSKATGTATPASGTTPLHSGTINLNGTAYTVQTLTLTATTADLTLAAGERVAIILSGAMSTGSGCLTIRYTLV